MFPLLQAQGHEHDDGLGIVGVILTGASDLDLGLKGLGQSHKVGGGAGMEAGRIYNMDPSQTVLTNEQKFCLAMVEISEYVNA